MVMTNSPAKVFASHRWKWETSRCHPPWNVSLMEELKNVVRIQESSFPHWQSVEQPNRYLSMSNNRWTSGVNVQVKSVESTASSEQSEAIIDTDRRSFLLAMFSSLSTAILRWKANLDLTTSFLVQNWSERHRHDPNQLDYVERSISCPLWTRSNWVTFCTCRDNNKIDDGIIYEELSSCSMAEGSERTVLGNTR